MRETPIRFARPCWKSGKLTCKLLKSPIINGYIQGKALQPSSLTFKKKNAEAYQQHLLLTHGMNQCLLLRNLHEYIHAFTHSQSSGQQRASTTVAVEAYQQHLLLKSMDQSTCASCWKKKELLSQHDQWSRIKISSFLSFKLEFI